MKNQVLVTQDSTISVIRRAKCRCKSMCRELLDLKYPLPIFTNADKQTDSTLRICLEPMKCTNNLWDRAKW